MNLKFTIKELVRATGGELVRNGSIAGVTGISIDSRAINKGECFVALKGAHFDGGAFVAEAIQKGAEVIVSSGEVEGKTAFIKVKDPIEALGDIAALWRRRFDVPCVAITGSNGKSTTKQMVASALASMGPVLRTEGNYNNLIGLPLTVFKWDKKDSVAVLEMGMNATGEIARLTQIARPDVGLITNVSPAHLELLGTIENVAKAKGELFATMERNKTIVVNLEDPWIKKLASDYQGKTYTFGMQNEADVKFGRLESRKLESTDMTIYVEGKEYKVHLAIPGTHNVMNAMAAIAVARVLGVSAEDAIHGAENFEPMPLRMERILLSRGVQIVNDCYNANPLSVTEALRTVSGAKKAGRFVAVLGEMLELGASSAKCHLEVGESVATFKVDKLFAFGEHASNIAEGAQKAGMNFDKCEVVTEMEDLKKRVLAFVDTGDIVLVKGSRGMQMERVVEHLKDEIGVE